MATSTGDHMNDDLKTVLTALVVIVVVITIGVLLHSVDQNSTNIKFAEQGYHQEYKIVCSKPYTELVWVKDIK